MFVSSYNTYISTNNSQKIEKKESPRREESSFSVKFSPKSLPVLSTTTNLPVNYISNYKVLNNQQKLQQETSQNNEKLKFTKINAHLNATNAYTDNSKIFSLLLKPRATLDQTPHVDKKLPVEVQEIQEENLRHTMVNTYIANDNYYKITA